MTRPNLLRGTLRPGVVARQVKAGIWSVLPATVESQPYDRRAALYDLLIGNRLYNRLAWGTSPDSYARFAATAIEAGDGFMLDAGCGSLVSTAELHARSNRPTILCDLSVGMLAAARDRLVRIAGRVPDHLLLLQADIFDLPFRDGAFGSVLCPGMLHLFEDVETVAGELARVAKGDCQIFMSSLVTDRKIGSQYLGLLHRTGEVAPPRTAANVQSRLLKAGLDLADETCRRGNMLFMSARKVDRARS